MKKVIFSKFSNERDRHFSIRTSIVEDENGSRTVQKVPCYPEGKSHIDNIYRWHQLYEHGNSPLKMNQCEKTEDGIVLEYLTGHTLEQELDKLLMGKKYDNMIQKMKEYFKAIYPTGQVEEFQITEEFRKVFGDILLPDGLVCGKITNIDMVFNNILITDCWNILDYEWTFDFPIPYNYVLFRALHYYMYIGNKRQKLWDMNLYGQMGLAEAEVLQYEKMEHNFQQYILGKHIPLQNLYKDISAGFIPVLEAAQAASRDKQKKRVQVYKDAGDGFKEETSCYIDRDGKGNVETDFSIPDKVGKIRIDPGSESCIVSVSRLQQDNSSETICKFEHNGIKLEDDRLLFLTDDPQIFIDGICEEVKMLHVKLIISNVADDDVLQWMARIKSLEEKRQEDLELFHIEKQQLNNKYEDLQAVLDEKIRWIEWAENTRTWKAYSKYRSMKEKIGRKDMKNSDKSIIYNIDRIVPLGEHMLIQGWMINRMQEDTIKVTDAQGNILNAHIERLERPDVNQLFGAEDGYKSGLHIMVERKKIQTSKIILEFRNEKEMRKIGISVRLFDLKRKYYKMVRKYIKPQQEVAAEFPLDYDSWIRDKFPTAKEMKMQSEEKFDYNPQISVIIPLYNTPLHFLKDILNSLLNQTYKNVQICLADGSDNNSVGKYIRANYGKETRIVYKKLEENRGISENTNEALEMATGDYIMLSDHDDEVTLDACYEIVKALNKDRTIDAIYSDEDKVSTDGKNYFDPQFKPDFNIDMLRCNNYICHIFVIQKAIVDKIGKFRNEYDGAQDFDFILRCCEQAKNVYHIPKILYHWRSHPNSTAGDPENKTYAYEAGRRAVEAHYKRIGMDAEVFMTENYGRYRTKLKVTGNPLISIIIPSMDHIDDLGRCVDSIFEISTYRNFEVLVIENNSKKEETFEYYEELKKKYENVKVIEWKREFNYSAINNYGVTFASGEYLLFLNNDIKVITEEWLEEMLSYCQRDDVGAVGAKLLYENDRIQHCGVIIGMGGGAAGHILYHVPRNAFTYGGRANSTHDLSAVTGACIMTKKDIFEKVGGFEEKFAVALNDVDYCLKIRQMGKLVVYNAYAELYHYESVSRGSDQEGANKERFADETNRFKIKWKEVFDKGDPYYNVNLTLQHADCSIKWS